MNAVSFPYGPAGNREPNWIGSADGCGERADTVEVGDIAMIVGVGVGARPGVAVREVTAARSPPDWSPETVRGVGTTKRTAEVVAVGRGPVSG